MNMRKIALHIMILILISTSAYAADKGNPPVAYWRFDESGGPTAYDESTNNNDGTLTPGAGGTNTAAGQMWTRQGKIGAALECDGTDDYVDITDATNALNVTTLTFTAWVKLQEDAGGSYHAIFQLFNSGASQGYQIFIPDPSYGGGTTSGELCIYTTGIVKSGLLTTAGVWNFIAIVVSGTNYTFYVNSQSSSKTGSGITQVDTVTMRNIGKYSTSGLASGLIDDVKIYNYARTADQIKVDYNAGMATYSGAGADPNEGNPPVLYLPFDENTGTTTYDKSGSGNNGTLTAGPAWVAGKYGSALSFDGTDDYVNLTHYSFNGQNIVTYSAFIKTSNASSRGASPSDTQHALFSQLEDSSMQIGIDNGKPAIYYYNYTGSQWVKVWANTYVADNAWHQITYILNATADTWSVYVDGVIDVNNGTLTGLNLIWLDAIGKSRYQGIFNGLIDDVKVYNYARSAGQIAYDYNKGKPVAQYRFDEGGGTIARNDYSNADTGSAPVGWWRMDNNWNDSSGNGNTGTASGNATFSSSSKIGPYAGTFDGAGDYVTVPDSDSLDLVGSTGTITVWVKINSYPATYWNILGKGASAGWDTNGYSIWYYTGPNYLGGSICDRSRSPNNTTVKFGEGATLPSTGVWHHLGLVWDGSYVYAYLDGVVVNKVTQYVNVPATADTFDISRRGGDYFNGSIDDIRVYNYARTAEQIYNDYKTTHGTLVGDTKFVDGKIGKALQFDGNGDYVAIGNVGLSTQTKTLEMWVKPDAITNDMRIISNTDNIGFSIRFQNSAIEVWGTSWQSVISSVSALEWQHLAFVFDGSGNVTGYRNGIAGSTKSVSESWSNLGLGCNLNFTYGSNYDGLIDDVRIYNYSRTAGQILQDYNAGVAANLGLPSSGTADPWGGAMPVAYWTLDENTGVLAKDASGNGNDGTLGGDGAGTDVPAWTQGRVGLCLSFDGGDYISSSVPQLSGVSQFTQEAWIKFNSIDNSYPAIFTRNGSWDGAIFLVQSGSKAGVQTGGSWTPGATALSANTWYHIVATYNGSIVKLYVNGKEDGSYSYSSAISATTPVTIGALSPSSYTFNGSIDDVKIYNYSRTPAQIAWDYNKGKPVAYWRFDESSGAACYDDTGNNNGTATIGGTGTQTTIAQARANGATGKFGRCMSFDGTDDYITVTNATTFNSTEWSVTAWVKIGSGDYQTLLSFNNGGRPLVELSHGTYPLLYLNDGVNDYYRYGNLDIKDNQWHHIAFLFRDSDNYVKIFVDGIDRTGSGPNGNEAAVTSTWRISDSGYKVNGLVDDVRVYNYVRTQDQLLQDYNQGLAAKLGE